MARKFKIYTPRMNEQEYQIECGEYRGVIKARSLGAAWRKLTKNRTEGFAPIARFVEDGVWKYVVPQYFDDLSE